MQCQKTKINSSLDATTIIDDSFATSKNKYHLVQHQSRCSLIERIGRTVFNIIANAISPAVVYLGELFGKLQSILNRKPISLLSNHENALALKKIKEIEAETAKPDAQGRFAKVYVCENFVIKDCLDDVENRIAQAKRARATCLKESLQHLWVPEHEIYTSTAGKQYLIERRVKLNYKETSWMYSFEYYYENKDKFNDAISEFTKFQLTHPMQDLFCDAGLWTPWGAKVGTQKYDNIPFCIKDDKFCISLIDLQDLAEKPGDIEQTIKTLINLFPYHTKIILEAAKSKEHTFDKEKIQSFEAIANQKQGLMNVMYVDHKKFAMQSYGAEIDHQIIYCWTEDEAQPICQAAYKKFTIQWQKQIDSWSKTKSNEFLTDSDIKQIQESQLIIQSNMKEKWETQNDKQLAKRELQEFYNYLNKANSVEPISLICRSKKLSSQKPKILSNNEFFFPNALPNV